MKHFLITIIPSEDVVLRIIKLRTQIFRNFGLVSSRCLPEMIPVSFIPKSISKGQFKGLTLPQAECTSVCSATEKGDIFLQIKDNNFTFEIKNQIDSFETSGIISIQTGFYLVTADTEEVIQEVLSFVNSEAEKNFRWKKNSLELIRIDTLNDIWWENIRWETIWEERIRLLGC